MDQNTATPALSLISAVIQHVKRLREGVVSAVLNVNQPDADVEEAVAQGIENPHPVQAENPPPPAPALEAAHVVGDMGDDDDMEQVYYQHMEAAHVLGDMGDDDAIMEQVDYQHMPPSIEFHPVSFFTGNIEDDDDNHSLNSDDYGMHENPDEPDGFM
jgi:hypothetical protein